MLQIRPQEPFPIVYLLTDPSDTGTYYVQTVLRESGTGKLISTTKLTVTAGNSRRFTGLIQAPTDPSGQGYWIDATTTVYTDSGYTTVATNYAEQLDRHLIAERWSMALAVGGGAHSYVDYDKIGELVKGKLDLLPAPEKAAPIDLTYLTNLLEQLSDFMHAFKIPEPEKLDLVPHVDKIISVLQDGFRAIPKPDLAPILKKIDDIDIPKPVEPEAVHARIKPLFDKLEKNVGAHLDEVKEINKSIPTVTIHARTAKEAPAASPFSDRVKRLLGK